MGVETVGRVSQVVILRRTNSSFSDWIDKDDYISRIYIKKETARPLNLSLVFAFPMRYQYIES